MIHHIITSRYMPNIYKIYVHTSATRKLHWITSVWSEKPQIHLFLIDQCNNWSLICQNYAFLLTCVHYTCTGYTSNTKDGLHFPFKSWHHNKLVPLLALIKIFQNRDDDDIVQYIKYKCWKKWYIIKSFPDTCQISFISMYTLQQPKHYVVLIKRI